jgi:hypothetical protein
MGSGAGERLSDGAGDVNDVRRVGQVVTRDAGPWTPAVHRLLRHLEAVGFEGAPRVVGLDRDRETLTFVDGDCPTLPWEPWVFTDETLVSVACLLRAYHDAAVSFRGRDDDRWRWWVGRGPDAGEAELICHTDLWPPNLVFRDGEAVALIDWDFAQPGHRLDDVASGAKHFVPLVAADRRAADGWPETGEEPRRLRLFCDAYGLTVPERAGLLEAVLDNNRAGYESHRQWGQAGVVGFAEMWAEGSGERILQDRAWLLDVWNDLAGALT